MRIRFFILMGFALLFLGCESLRLPSIEGDWLAVTPHNKYDYLVRITKNMIYEDNPQRRTYKYTVSKDYIHIVKLSLSETADKYAADYKYSFTGDTLIIHEFLLSAVATCPPTYTDYKLVKLTK